MDADTLPPGWWMSNRGPVSPRGVLHEVIPAGYELADMQAWEDTLDILVGPCRAVRGRPRRRPRTGGGAMTVQSPGVRCEARDGEFWCSRDEGHPGAHVSRSESGPGCVGWRNDAAVHECPHGLDLRTHPRCYLCEPARAFCPVHGIGCEVRRRGWVPSVWPDFGSSDYTVTCTCGTSVPCLVHSAVTFTNEPSASSGRQ